MIKNIINITTQSVIYSIILIVILFSNTTSSTEDDDLQRSSPLILEDVYLICNDSINSDDEDTKKIAIFLCHMYVSTIYESFFYHRAFTQYFKERGDIDDEKIVNTAEIYNPFGCDINDLDEDYFIKLVIKYSDSHQEELKDSFYFTLRNILEPYCSEQINKKTEFYLSDLDGRRKT